MTRERRPDQVVSVLDLNIRRYTNAANANRGLAEHFAQQADLDEELRDYWIGERDKMLGGAGLENVIPFPQPREGDGAA